MIILACIAVLYDLFIIETTIYSHIWGNKFNWVLWENWNNNGIYGELTIQPCIGGGNRGPGDMAPS